MTAVVLGGTGFLGGHVCRALAAAGRPVVVVSRRRLPGVVQVAHDERAYDELTALFARLRPEVVVNASGMAWAPIPDPENSVNCSLAAAAAEAARDTGVPRLVHFGSSHEYAPAPHGSALPEDFETGPRTPYGTSKFLGTQAVLKVASDGVDAVVLRVFNAFGPGVPEASLLGQTVRRLLAGERVIELRQPLQYRDFVDARDVASAVTAAAAAAPGTFAGGTVLNVGRGEGLCTRDVVDGLIEASGLDARTVLTDADGGSRVAGLDWQCADTTRIGAMLGWKPAIGISATLADLWESAERGDSDDR